jgi:hypothetical protein
MAKNSQVGFFEQHVEKLVLAAGLLVLLYYLFSSGLGAVNTLTVFAGGKGQQVEVDPGNVDRTLQQAAEKLESKARASSYVAVSASGTSLVELANPRLQGINPMCELGSPCVVVTTQPAGTGLAATGTAGTATAAPGKLTLAALTAVPPPSKPVVVLGQELLRAEGKSLDVTAAHIVCIYPWQDLVARWTNAMPEALRMAPVQPAPVMLEVQVQERLPGGGWSAEKSISTVARMVDSQGRPVAALPPIPDWDGTPNGWQLVQNAIGMYTQQAMLPQVIQPDYWDLWNGSTWVSWRVNLPYTEVSDMGELPASPAMSYGPPMPGMTPAPAPAPLLPGGKEVTLSSSAKVILTGSGTAPVPAGTAALTTTALPPGQAARANKLPMPTPSLATQMQANKLLVWAHDANATFGKTYHYRTRLTLLNPQYGVDGVFANAAEARTKLISTPWSDWSDSVTAANAVEFFATGKSENLQSVSFTVYTRSSGQWVKYAFNVHPGEKIGGLATVEMLDPATGQRVRVPNVDFATGATLVSVDFGRKVYPPSGAGRPIDATEVVVMDSAGVLHSRMVELDRGNERMQKLDKEVKSLAPLHTIKPGGPGTPPPAPVPSPGGPDVPPYDLDMPMPPGGWPR